jgi:hypothetical protein
MASPVPIHRPRRRAQIHHRPERSSCPGERKINGVKREAMTRNSHPLKAMPFATARLNRSV